MRIKKIKINNYKSFGATHNEIWMTSDVMAIVGKNGSGKTNILKALQGLKFFSSVDHETLSCSNYFLKLKTVSIVFEIEITEDDYKSLNIENTNISPSKENVRFEFFKLNDWGFFMSFKNIVSPNTLDESSIFSKMLKQDSNLAEIFKRLLTATQNDKNQYNEKDKNIHDSLAYFAEHWASVYSCLDYSWIKNHYGNNIKEADIAYLKEHYDIAMLEFSKIMPRIFFYDDTDSLKDCYKRDDLAHDNQKFFKQPSALQNLIRALDIDKTVFLQAMDASDINHVKTIRRQIELELNEFNKNFNSFYNNQQEKIELKLNFEKGLCYCDITKANDPTTFKLSERSNGLRWYLTFFAGLKSINLNEHALILIDEPAVHLHVDAQKEVLKLFDHLVQKGHQIIYTTHNPSMLDINQWERIKAVEKVDEISKIFSLYTSKKQITNLETLSPVQQAMGCCLKNTLAPCSNRCNLITEGISDYYYLETMGKICKIPEDVMPYIIPASGASAIPNIFSILLGWGYPVKILLDNDAEGIMVAEKLQNKFPEHFDGSVFMVSDETGYCIENILSKEDLNHFKCTNKKGEFIKTMTALNFMNEVSRKSYNVSDETRENFTTLFRKLGFLKEE